jgi:plastocyanin
MPSRSVIGGDAVRLIPLALVLSLAAPLHAASVEGEVKVLGRRGYHKDLSDVVVYLEGAADGAPGKARAEIRMARKRFEPRVAVVPVGATVEFPNDDPILHNVFSVSGDNRFDLDLYKRPEVGRKTFESPGLVRVYCNIHPQMSAFVLVTRGWHHTMADASGRFRLEGVPRGRYTLRAWHERAREEASVEIEVGAQGAAPVSLELDASKYRPARHKNKYGKEYDKDRY